MSGIGDSIEKLFNAELSYPTLLFRFIEGRLKRMGVVLTAEQEGSLRGQLNRQDDEGIAFSLELTDREGLPIGPEEELRIEADLQNAFQDPHAIETFTKNIEAKLQAATMAVVPKIAKRTWEKMRQRASSQARLLKKDRRALIKNGMGPWHKALDMLELFVSLAKELNGFAAEEKVADSMESQDALTTVLNGLHDRGCEVASEIHWLLVSGYAHGALARWRSLHEISVTATLISDGGKALAQKYLDHLPVEVFKAARAYQGLAATYGWEKYTDEEFSLLRDSHDAQVEQYGNSFKGDYGWAAEALNNGNPKFQNLEARVGLGHLRPLYKDASTKVHACPSGTFLLGLHREEDDFLLFPKLGGLGIAEAGVRTAQSLALLSSALLIGCPTWDLAVGSYVTLEMEADLEKEFAQVDAGIT